MKIFNFSIIGTIIHKSSTFVYFRVMRVPLLRGIRNAVRDRRIFREENDGKQG